MDKKASDTDMVKMAQLYCLLDSFLLPRQEKVYIVMNHILIIDDEDVFNSYSWGRVAFQLLATYMKKAW